MSLRKHLMAISALAAAGGLLYFEPLGEASFTFALAFSGVGLLMGVTN